MKKLVIVLLVSFFYAMSNICYSQYRNDTSPDSVEIRHMLATYVEQIDYSFLNNKSVSVCLPITRSIELEPLDNDIPSLQKEVCKAIIERGLINQGVVVPINTRQAEIRIDIIIAIDNSYTEVPLPLMFSNSSSEQVREYCKFISIWILYTDTASDTNILTDRLVTISSNIIQHKKNIYEQIDKDILEESPTSPASPASPPTQQRGAPNINDNNRV